MPDPTDPTHPASGDTPSTLAAKEPYQLGLAIAEGCRQGRDIAMVEAHFHPDAESIEATGERPLVKGKRAIVAKARGWFLENEVHSVDIEGPFTHGDDRFALVFHYRASLKATGEQYEFREVAVYEVVDGLVVRERFFYDA